MLESELGALEQHGDIAAPPPPPAPELKASKQPEKIHPFSELSGGVMRAFLISWGLFTLVVLAAFSGHIEVVFVLGVVLTFGAVFFVVPAVLLRIKAKREARVSNYVETPNGRMSQTAVMVQIVMVPLILAVGMAIVGYIATNQ